MLNHSTVSVEEFSKNLLLKDAKEGNMKHKILQTDNFIYSAFN